MSENAQAEQRGVPDAMATLSAEHKRRVANFKMATGILILLLVASNAFWYGNSSGNLPTLLASRAMHDHNRSLTEEVETSSISHDNRPLTEEAEALKADVEQFFSKYGQEFVKGALGLSGAYTGHVVTDVENSQDGHVVAAWTVIRGLDEWVQSTEMSMHYARTENDDVDLAYRIACHLVHNNKCAMLIEGRSTSIKEIRDRFEYLSVETDVLLEKLRQMQ